jgi:hypothetical protein
MYRLIYIFQAEVIPWFERLISNTRHRLQRAIKNSRMRRNWTQWRP